MLRLLLVLVSFALVPLAAPQAIAGAAATADARVHEQDMPYFEACAREGLNASECVGRLIWFKATAGNDRFHTYTFQQRVGVLIDWFRVLRTRSARRPLLGLGHHQRPVVLQARRAATARPRRPTKPTASTGARATTCCSNTSASRAMSIRPAASRTRRSTADDPHTRAASSTSASRPATSSSAPRPARSACASSPTRASTRDKWKTAQWHARPPGPASTRQGCRRPASNPTSG